MTSPEAQVYLNGRFVPRSQATLDIEDRGALFADGVYEVVRYYAGRPLAVREHIDRLRGSLDAIQLPPPPQVDRLDAISDELLSRNGLTDAKLYWQVTRGSAPRDHAYPDRPTPTLLAIAYPQPPLDPSAQPPAVRAILTEDLRWHLCSIKSLMLLPNVLAKNAALQAGAYEAILHRGGRVTEATATSVFVVREDQLWTHPADQWILDGITRRMLLDQARQAGMTALEQPFTTTQLLEADEVILCGTTNPVAGVVGVDDRMIGGGGVGPVTKRLHALLMRGIQDACGLG